MNWQATASETFVRRSFYFPLWELLNPRQYTRWVFISLLVGTLLGWGIALWFGAPALDVNLCGATCVAAGWDSKVAR